jgi:hypothetical protein
MTKYFILIAFVFACLPSRAQTNFGNEWSTCLGYKFNFNTVPLTHDTFLLNNGYTYFTVSSSCVSDSSGYIVLQCDGGDIVNRSSIHIENGDSIIPFEIMKSYQGIGRSSQASIILPMENKKYYVFTPTVSDSFYTNVWLNKPSLNWNFDLLLYHVVDMNLNGGQGKVIEKKKVLTQNKPLKKSMMMACRHANGKDWWLLKMAGDTNMVFTFLVKQDTILPYPNQGIPFPNVWINDLYGQMKFSKDGTKWATTCAGATEYNYGKPYIYVADFDRCTGQLSGFKRFESPVWIDTNNLGLEFSPNGQMLYISKYNVIQQLDLTTETWFNVHGPDSNAFCGYVSLHLGPDDKIYISRFVGVCKEFSYIANPNAKGAACDFCTNCLRSKSNGVFDGLPTMPNYELGALAQTCWPLMNEEVIGNKTSWEVYPNPAQGVVYIKHKDGKTKRLYNTLGQLLDETHSTLFDVSRLSRGIYFVQCEGVMKKVVVE